MEKLADIKTNFPEWYQDIVYMAELVDQSPTAGCFVIKPYGYALWENIVQVLDAKIKETGTENAYFPLLIPESFLKKEKEHVEGFAPEVAVVTHAGGKELEEPFVIRPTSETIIYYMFSKWIKSWRDLPLKVNQWANVVRWEMRPRAFLRTREFLWQEGHTAHRNKEEATAFAKHILKMYTNFIEDYLAIPVVAGEKSPTERFAGADATYTMEAVTLDGKALQMGTSHVLKQSFSKSFEIVFQDTDNSMQTPQCTSWGLSTRLIGAIISVHGDQKGLIIPPKVAPIQVVVIPIYKKDEEKAVVLEKTESLAKQLKGLGIRVKVDNDDQKSPGAKFYHWEMKGVPIRVEIGPKDVEAGHVAAISRLAQDKSEKQFLPFTHAADVIVKSLDIIQKQLFERARQSQKEAWNQAGKLEDFGSTLDQNNGIYQVGWCGSAGCEAKLKPFKGTIRCVIPDKKHTECFACSAKAEYEVLVAKTY